MLSRRSIDMLLDLIENRVACMQVIDREDHRQLAILTQARREILSMSAQVKREERGKSRPAAAPVDVMAAPALPTPAMPTPVMPTPVAAMLENAAAA
ncbi:MAG: hypothetical protein JNK67_03510 [Alphaproteobacteria bacterium]|nr:hypothetical protein [Alphaproteobacteria bacterium]